MECDTLCDLLDGWCRRTGLRIEQLATLIGVDRSSVYRWRKGASQPETKHIEKLARALGERLAVVAAAIDESRRQREGIPA